MDKISFVESKFLWLENVPKKPIIPKNNKKIGFGIPALAYYGTQLKKCREKALVIINADLLPLELVNVDGTYFHKGKMLKNNVIFDVPQGFTGIKIFQYFSFDYWHECSEEDFHNWNKMAKNEKNAVINTRMVIRLVKEELSFSDAKKV